MTKFALKFTSAIASASLIATMMAPAVFADTTVTIGPTGTNSDNEVKIEGTGGSSIGDVKQSNSTSVTAIVSTSSDTGNNSADKNTTGGGDVTVDTGNATAISSVSVVGGSNTATLNGCGCNGGNTNVTIQNTGTNSDNKVEIKKSKKKAPKESRQRSRTTVVAVVGTASDTGGNSADKNTTGSEGIVEVLTGVGSATTAVGVTAGTNTLTVNP